MTCVLLTTYSSGDQTMEDEMGKACGMHGRGEYHIPKGLKLLGRQYYNEP